MSEHLKRLIFHEVIPEEERFNIGQDKLNWYRGGGPERVLNNAELDGCGGPAHDGALRVFTDPVFHHKGGLVTEYRGSIFHVHDVESNTEYVAALVVDNSGTQPLRKLSEELARVAQTPGLYIHLASLADYVNPVRAHLVVVSDEPATLDLITKPYQERGDEREGWSALAGTEVQIPVGQSAHDLSSVCLTRSEQVHIRGRLRTESGREAISDLHYVIIDHDQVCP